MSLWISKLKECGADLGHFALLRCPTPLISYSVWVDHGQTPCRGLWNYTIAVVFLRNARACSRAKWSGSFVDMRTQIDGLAILAKDVIQQDPASGQIVLFDYDPSRGGAVPVRLLEGFHGVLVTDGYVEYLNARQVQ
jgi:hypothetical protein